MALNVERLEKLAAFLDGVPPLHFRINCFITPNTTKEVLERLLKAPDHKCGAAACAVGWCPIALPEIFCYTLARGSCIGVRLIGKLSAPSFSAAREAFELSPQQTEWLFAPNSYSSDVAPSNVANRIRQLIKEEKELAHGQ